MEMIVDEPERESTYKGLRKKILDISDNIGDAIYTEKDIGNIKKKTATYIKPKSKVNAIPETIKFVDTINASIKKEKEVRRLIGLSILSIIILAIVSIILYIVNYILSLIFDAVAWWIVAIIMIGIIVPLFTAIAYLMAKGDY